MRIQIDTSYFLPLIKIAIEKIPSDLLINLLNESPHQYYYSELSLFELTAKGLKYSSQEDKLTPQDIRIGIDTLQNDNRLIKVSYINNPLIIELASELRKIHNDTIDCLIFSTAICTCECIITMDLDFYDEISKDLEIIKKIHHINNNFKFWFGDLSKDHKTLILREEGD